MSLETNTIKTNLEAGSFKALQNVADAARQVMLGEEQEKQELQELINIIGSAKYVSEDQKEAMIAVMLKEESPDEMKDDLRDLQNKLRDKASYRNSQVGWKEDEYEALEDRIEKKKAAIKDAESSGRHTSS